jgi:hypothetical protein
VRAGPPRVFAVASEVPPSNKAAIRADLDMPFLQAASYATGNDGNSDGSSVRISFTDSVSVSAGSETRESKQAFRAEPNVAGVLAAPVLGRNLNRRTL